MTSRTSYTLIFFSIVFLSLIAYLIIDLDTAKMSSQDAVVSKKIITDQQSNTVKTEPVTPNKNYLQSNVSNKTVDATKNSQTDNNNPWQRDSNTKLKAFPYKNTDDLHYEYVRFNRDVISQLQIDHELLLYIPHTKNNFIGIVKNKSVSERGNTTYTGSLLNYDKSYRFTITQAAATTYATIRTPDGKYIVEAIGNDAWVYDDRELRLKFINSPSDAILMDVEKFKSF